ncbi:YfbM family protein [Spirochaeta cellobiosiphila]|uniref:YfbM family protein n=1 Tax=Spirochaeta cellobiosiphila TaxID=504483 RepID=UPI0004015C04|nr:YfbM family protein [Spirochaeta cellobiosiphila]
MSMIGNLVRCEDAKINEFHTNPNLIEDFVYGSNIDSSKRLDLDKSWHAIHFIISGSAWEGDPPQNFLMSGQPIGNIDLGYGPARTFLSSEVKNINDFLNSSSFNFSTDDLVGKLSMNEIYPQVWNRQEDIDYIKAYFQELKLFINNAVDEKEGLILFIN